MFTDLELKQGYGIITFFRIPFITCLLWFSDSESNETRKNRQLIFSKKASMDSDRFMLVITIIYIPLLEFNNIDQEQH